MKKTIGIIITILLIFISLNFIPVKFAIRDTQNIDNGYVCEYQAVTDGNWFAKCSDNPHLSEDIYINVRNDSFENVAEVAGIYYTGMPILNTYIFYGDIEKREVTDGVFLNFMDALEWDIVYPVKRAPFRDLFTPQGYLTIYDYDWKRVIENWINS